MADTEKPEKELPLGHEYIGNICGGFGGTLECKYPVIGGRHCGKSPFEHEPLGPQPPGLVQFLRAQRGVSDG